MNEYDDISESVPQGVNGEKEKEDSRIQEISDELDRRCRIHEAQSDDSQGYATPFEIEQREAERLAKEKGYWISIMDIMRIGIPGPSGNENDTYVDNDTIYKVNNLMNSKSIRNLLNKILLHNRIFSETAYSFYGFTGYDGRAVMPVFKQDLVKDATPATQAEIDAYMAAIGFNKEDTAGRFSNAMYIIWDVIPRNALRDKDGDIYVIDAELKKI
ncbi:MAG: hypothetical protein IKP63_02620 [Paludibacteraceae bacterium]|nr:hypothetical protein [Paludibacteraceae bacterium]MBR6804144.1 hypothetical protein [Paludibacteraceae bacterium]